MTTSAAGVAVSATPNGAVFLRWVGGKRQLLPEIRARMPETFVHYCEPFMGGAALFFDLVASGRLDGVEATIGDANPHLARCYRGLRDDVDGVIQFLRIMPFEKDYYYALRAEGFDGASQTEAAARFIYLNRTCFNGLWRVNKAGKNNVPIGKFAKPPTVCDESTLRAASRALRQVSIVNEDFETIARGAAHRLRGGGPTFFYFDPPYWPASGTADFTSYTKAPFGPTEQMHLRDLARDLKNDGARVLLSNADVEPVRELYADGFKVERISARRSVNSDASKRGPVGELLIS